MMLAPLLLAGMLSAAGPGEDAGRPPERPQSMMGVGAQAEFLGPAEGLAGVLFSYDVTRFQFEGSLAVGIFENGPNNTDKTDTYGLSVRIYLPIHRRAGSDFSLGGGGGVALLKAPTTAAEWASTLFVGGRVRIFVAPNACITGALGAGALLRQGGSALLIAARPLGSAGFVYYFF
ncbi:MAG TPA: hypothetical protein VIG99_03730 [Myxococcaceae bacterium]